MQDVSFHQVTHDPYRVLHPMKRDGASWQRISWEQAVQEIGARLKRIRTDHGGDAIGLYTGNPAGYSYSHRVFSSNFVDAVGSHTLVNACAQTKYCGAVAACGLAQGMDLPGTVAPFILRGVTLIGIDSVMAPKDRRFSAWRRLAKDLDPSLLLVPCLRDELGQIQLVRVDDPASVERLDGGLYRVREGGAALAEAQPGEDGAGLLVQGAVERSNVSLTDEMVRLMLVQRAYAANSQIVQAADQLMAIANGLRR